MCMMGYSTNDGTDDISNNLVTTKGSAEKRGQYRPMQAQPMCPGRGKRGMPATRLRLQRSTDTEDHQQIDDHAADRRHGDT